MVRNITRIETCIRQAQWHLYTGAKRTVSLLMERLNAGHDRVAIRLGRGGGRAGSKAECRQCQTLEAEEGRRRRRRSNETSLLGFRELTAEMRQNGTRDERRRRGKEAREGAAKGE